MPAFRFSRFWVVVFLVVQATHAVAQHKAPSKAQLEKQRAIIQKEIDEVRRSLDDTRKNKRENLQQLSLLQRRLQLRESAIRNMNQQIDRIQGDMAGSQRDIATLTAQLDTLRAQYAQSLVFAYKNRSNYDFLNFIFSAASIDDAIRRWQYLKSYRTYREGQAEDILRTQNLLQSKIDGLKMTRVEKEDALKKQSQQKALLENERKEKNQVASRLMTQEKDLARRMAMRQQQDKRLRLAIQAAMRRAMAEAAARRAQERAREKAEADRQPRAATDRQARSSTEPQARSSAERQVRSNTERLSQTTTDRRARAATDRQAQSSADRQARSSTDGQMKTSSRPTHKSVSPPDFARTEDIALSRDFEKSKGSLPWPVNGTVTETYGLHEYMKGITHFNMGWTMEAPGASVKAVFEGEVQDISDIGGDQMVMIRHGSYFTTYSNLGTVAVTKGQRVHAGQVIGRIAEGQRLEFIISEDGHEGTLDPAKWIRR